MQLVAVVAIGARNRRRTTAAAVSLVALAAVTAAAFLLLRPANNSSSVTSSGSSRSSAPTLVTDRLVYGMTKAEVLRRVGKPTRTVGACWQYRENKSIWNGQHVLNALRVCFLSGGSSYQSYKMDGAWFYPTTPLKIGS
jgi:hypothetical protein